MQEKRLTKKQSLILLAVGIIILIIARGSGILAVVGGATTLYSIFSLLSKNGLRWK